VLKATHILRKPVIALHIKKMHNRGFPARNPTQITANGALGLLFKHKAFNLKTKHKFGMFCQNSQAVYIL
jgi:hypothetical protein